jgi:hypothetical protein
MSQQGRKYNFLFTVCGKISEAKDKLKEDLLGKTGGRNS